MLLEVYKNFHELSSGNMALRHCHDVAMTLMRCLHKCHVLAGIWLALDLLSCLLPDWKSLHSSRGIIL